MKSLFIILVSLIALVFSACSSKKVYEPSKVKGDWEAIRSSEFTIKDISPDSALVEGQKVVVKNRILDVNIPEDDRLLGYSDGWVISSNIDGNLTIVSSETKKVEIFNLKKTIAAASIKGDVLAVLFTDNEMALYSIANKSILLKEQGDAPIVVNSKIVKPYFKDDLVLFSTLDGKVVIINSKIKKKLRTIIVSGEAHFNNVIYFSLVDNKIIAATGHKILSLAQKEIRLAYDIRSVIEGEKEIFVATKQGEIISLTPELQQNAKLKLPFAHFLGMILNKDKLYVLEKEGYLIEISKDLSKYSVYEADIGNGYVFIDDKIFFVDDRLISVE